MSSPMNVVTKVKHFLDKLNPVPFFSKLDQEIRENESSQLQQEVHKLGLALDEYLRDYIRSYYKTHAQISTNFNFVYRSASALKKELRGYLNDWISSNCDRVSQCYVEINVKPEYGFHTDQQIIVYISDSPNKNKFADTMLYRVLRFGNSSITILHTQS